MSTFRKPVALVNPGQRITATLWNDTATTINDRLAPIDLEAGRLEGEAALPGTRALIATEVSRTSTTVRVENPEDENQYVDVDRPTQILFQLADGRALLLNLVPPG